MTKEEAINWLRNLRADIGKIEHQELWHYEQALAEIMEMIDGLPSEQPEPCEDDPRADVYYLAEKIGIHRLYALVVALRGEPEPCKDTISRQAAIEHLKKRLYETALNNYTEHPYYEDMADNRVSVCLEEVPSAQPDRKKGRWIYNGSAGWSCSECRAQAPFIWMSDKQKKSNYCYNCGAKLEKGEEDE